MSVHGKSSLPFNWEACRDPKPSIAATERSGILATLLSGKHLFQNARSCTVFQGGGKVNSELTGGRKRDFVCHSCVYSPYSYHPYRSHLTSNTCLKLVHRLNDALGGKAPNLKVRLPVSKWNMTSTCGTWKNICNYHDLGKDVSNFTGHLKGYSREMTYGNGSAIPLAHPVNEASPVRHDRPTDVFMTARAVLPQVITSRKNIPCSQLENSDQEIIKERSEAPKLDSMQTGIAVTKENSPVATNREKLSPGLGLLSQSADRPPVLTPPVNNDTGPSFEECSPPVQSPLQCPHDAISKEETIPVRNISAMFGTSQIRCENSNDISDVPLDYSLKKKNRSSFTSETCNVNRQREDINCNTKPTDAISNKYLLGSYALLGSKQSHLIYGTTEEGVEDLEYNNRTVNLNQSKYVRVNLDEEERGVVTADQSCCLLNFDPSGCAKENLNQLDCGRLNLGQSEYDKVNSDQSEYDKVNLGQSEYHKLNLDQSRRETLNRETVANYLPVHSFDEQVASETLLILSRDPYNPKYPYSHHKRLPINRESSTTLMDSRKSVHNAYSSHVSLPPQFNKYPRSSSLDERNETRDTIHSCCPAEDKDYTKSCSKLSRRNSVICSLKSSNASHLSDEMLAVAGSSSDLSSTHVESDNSRGDSPAGLLACARAPCILDKNKSPEAHSESGTPYEARFRLDYDGTGDSARETKTSRCDSELLELRFKLQLLLYVVLGRERLCRLGFPTADTDNILHTMLTLANITPSKSQLERDVLPCFRDNIRKMLLLCVPQEELWDQYGWRDLTVDAILERLYRDEVLPYLEEVRRCLSPEKDDTPEWQSRTRNAQLDSSRPEQRDSSTDGQTDSGERGAAGSEAQGVNNCPSGSTECKGVKPKRGRGRPRKWKVNNILKRKRFFLWRFLLELLQNPQNSGDIKWLRREDGIFQIINSSNIARRWGCQQGNPNMNYEKMARAMRMYYVKKVLTLVPREGSYPKKLVYKFSPGIMKLLDDGFQ